MNETKKTKAGIAASTFFLISLLLSVVTGQFQWPLQVVVGLVLCSIHYVGMNLFLRNHATLIQKEDNVQYR